MAKKGRDQLLWWRRRKGRNYEIKKGPERIISIPLKKIARLISERGEELSVHRVKKQKSRKKL